MKTNYNNSNMLPSGKKSYRTKSKAGDIAEMPSSLVTITHPEYQNALSFYKKSSSNGESTAYLTSIVLPEDMEDAVVQSFELRIEDRRILLGNIPVAEADFRDLVTDQRVVNLNLHLLSAIYSILYLNLSNAWEAEEADYDIQDYSVEIYIPALMHLICNSRKYNEQQKQAMISSLKEFHSIIGVIENKDNSRNRTDRYALLLIHNTQESRNTLRISSPYMLELLKVLRKGRARNMKKKGGENNVKTLPNYSFLIKGSIVTAKSRRAAEIVDIVIKVIEQTGSSRRYTPNISAKSIIDRCPMLKAAYDSCKGNAEKNKLLKRTFETAWNYLREYTYLDDKYNNFQYPDSIPSVMSLRERILFKHSGLKEQSDRKNYDDSS